MQNATITIIEAKTEIDDTTGYRTEKAEDDEVTLVDEERCFFSRSQKSRSVFATQRELVKLVDAALLTFTSGTVLKVGMTATVTPDGESPIEYKVGHAFILPGIAQRQWYVELEAVDTPVA